VSATVLPVSPTRSDEPKVEARRTRHRCRIADDGNSFIDTYTQVLEDHILVRSERIIDENPFPGTFSV
jgi:hypothetical protein